MGSFVMQPGCHCGGKLSTKTSRGLNGEKGRRSKQKLGRSSAMAIMDIFSIL